MKQVILAMTMLAAPASLAGQTDTKTFKYNGLAYTSFLAGACNHRYTNVGFTGGGEGFLWRGLTLGAEAGYFDFPGDRSSGYGVGTLNVGYHFVNRYAPKRWDPFVSTTALGLGFGAGGHGAAGSLGGGVVYWFKPRLGLRVGGQVQVLSREEYIPQFSIGLAFR